MSEKINYEGLRKLLDDGAQLVEVLPREEYAAEHLPGAINIPLKELDRDSATQLDRERPVIVYCWDWLRDMSPRAHIGTTSSPRCAESRLFQRDSEAPLPGFEIRAGALRRRTLRNVGDL